MVLDRIRGREIVSEIIGRVSLITVQEPVRTVDLTRTDYKAWAELYHGRRKTFQLGSLFARPIVEAETSFVMGDGVQVITGDDALDEEVNEWLGENHSVLMSTYRQYLKLGDAFLAVNPDGSIDELTPNGVKVRHDDFRPRTIREITVKSLLDSGASIEDSYTEEQRTVTLRNGRETIVETFPNMIGRIPITLLANRRDPDEEFGRPIYDALVWFFARYNDVLDKALMGVEMMAVPKPSIQGADDAERAKRLIATDTETIKDADGADLTQHVIDWDDLTMVVTEGNAKFGFESPSPFANEFNIVLKKAFLLLLEHSSIPEWVWGGAVQSSKASVDAQMPAFMRYIAGRRADFEQFLTEIIRTFIAYRRLFSLQPANVKIKYQWPAIIEDDQTNLREWVQFALSNGLISKVDALRLSPLPIDDPEASVAAANEEFNNAQEEFERRVATDLNEPDEDDEDDD